MFLYNLPKPSVNVCLMKILKSTVTKKVIVCFYNLRSTTIQYSIQPIFGFYQKREEEMDTANQASVKLLYLNEYLCI